MYRYGIGTEKNMKTDLGGQCALLSTDFYYFGNNPKPQPNNLKGIIKQGQSHRSTSNDEYADDFIEWIRNYASVNGVFIPSPDDYRRNWAEYEKEIQACKPYL